VIKFITYALTIPLDISEFKSMRQKKSDGSVLASSWMVDFGKTSGHLLVLYTIVCI
jgi:hypothetical protein